MQGLGGAVVSAVALSLIMTLFTEPAERAKAMGVFGFVMAGGGSIGVLLGGVLTDVARLALDLPRQRPDRRRRLLALAAAAAVRATAPPSPERLDVAGAVTVTAALMLAVYAIVNGNDAGWTSGQTLGLLARRRRAAGGRSSCIEARVASPLVPLGLFRLRNVATANVVGVLWAAAMFAWFFLSALYLQLVLGYTPAAGRPRLPAGQPDHGGVLARPLRQARDALRHPDAARDRAWRSPRSASLLFARAPVDGTLRRRRAARA